MKTYSQFEKEQYNPQALAGKSGLAWLVLMWLLVWLLSKVIA